MSPYALAVVFSLRLCHRSLLLDHVHFRSEVWNDTVDDLSVRSFHCVVFVLVSCTVESLIRNLCLCQREVW